MHLTTPIKQCRMSLILSATVSHTPSSCLSYSQQPSLGNFGNFGWSSDIVLAEIQDNKKIKSEEPYFELLTTELVATEERVFNVSRFLPAIRYSITVSLAA